MLFTTVAVNRNAKNEFLLGKQWFDYTPAMNAILNALHQRILNLEISLQPNNQISIRLPPMIDKNLSNPHSSDARSPQSAYHSISSDRHSPLDKQFQKLNLSSHIPFEPINIDNSIQSGQSNYRSLPSLNLPLNQMKTRAYEYAAIFENAFDQLNVIHYALFTNHFSINQFQFDPVDLQNINSNLAGIAPMKERDKLLSEIEYFFHLLILIFRALLLDTQPDLFTSINHFSSEELIQLNNRLKFSQDKISKLSFLKKHFHREKSQQLNAINSTRSQLKDRFMEEKSRSKISLRYCHDWKKNHILQWIEMLFQIERDSIQTLHEYENILKQTERTHEETIRILTEQRNEMKFNANKWYEYYQTKTIRFERELSSLRFEFNQSKKQREEMNEEYQRMKEIVDEYHQIKMKERLFLEKQKQEEQAIEHIQTWWRGILVRHLKQKQRKKKKKQIK